jgi:hypothetical protein
MMVRPQSRQSGAVLMVTLVMLIMVTLLGVASANLVQSNLKVVENIEARSAARNAALTALQEAIALGELLEGDLAFSTSCQSNTYARCLDLSGDNVTDDIVVRLDTPECISAAPVKNSQLDVFASAADASCYQPGVYSLCADAVWEVTAVAVDNLTGARVEVRQGLSTRTTVNLISAACI